MRITAHLFRKYSRNISQKAAILRLYRTWSSIDYTTLTDLLLSLDPPDGYELLCHFIPSERHVPGFIENLVLSFDAPEVYAMFGILLRRPLSGKVIDMFMDWIVAIDRKDASDLAAPVYSLCGMDEYLLECGRALFKLMMMPGSQRSALPDSLLSALVRCFDACCRRCHPSVIFRPPALPPPPISVRLDLAGTVSRFPLVAESDSSGGGPESIEDVFFMLGSMMRLKPQIPASVAASVVEFFEQLKR
jgi:hypothetical protein